MQYLDSGDTKVLVAEDLDGDGKKDLITATETGENVIWKKDEAGLFVDTNQDIFTWGTEAILAHDVNNDGCIDLVWLTVMVKQLHLSMTAPVTLRFSSQ